MLQSPKGTSKFVNHHLWWHDVPRIFHCAACLCINVCVCVCVCILFFTVVHVQQVTLVMRQWATTKVSVTLAFSFTLQPTALPICKSANTYFFTFCIDYNDFEIAGLPMIHHVHLHVWEPGRIHAVLTLFACCLLTMSFFFFFFLFGLCSKSIYKSIFLASLHVQFPCLIVHWYFCDCILLKIRYTSSSCLSRLPNDCSSTTRIDLF